MQTYSMDSATHVDTKQYLITVAIVEALIKSQYPLDCIR